jgi:hypothetical protein
MLLGCVKQQFTLPSTHSFSEFSLTVSNRINRTTIFLKRNELSQTKTIKCKMQPKSFTASNSNISKVLKVEKKFISFYYFFYQTFPYFG